jgi:hypothetical protein
MLHPPREGFWQRLEREATEKAARLDRSGNPDSDDDEEDDIDAPEDKEPRRSLRQAQKTTGLPYDTGIPYAKRHDRKFVAKRGSMAVRMAALRGQLRLYGIRMGYADDLGNEEADYDLHDAIER